jgi:hypothetical protein
MLAVPPGAEMVGKYQAITVLASLGPPESEAGDEEGFRDRFGASGIVVMVLVGLSGPFLTGV